MIQSKTTLAVWTINGYLLLAVLTFGLFSMGQNLFARLRADDPSIERGALVGEASQVAQEFEVVPQHLIYDSPRPVGTSPYYLASVYVTDRELDPEVRSAIENAGDLSLNLFGARVNVLFFTADRREVHALLDTVAYVNRVDVPAHQSAGRVPREFPHLVFEIAMRDSNGDNRLNSEDERAFYLSDYSGRDLRQITPDGLDLVDYWYDADQQVLFFEEVRVGTSETVHGIDYTLDERRLHYYDLVSGEFGAFEELDTVFGELRRQYKLND
ncbi:MAG: hypothetical protein AAGI08_10630 [Bacteroidota bacterium]